jgi:hypothetical protein
MKKAIALSILIAMISGVASAERFLRVDRGSASVNHGDGFAAVAGDTPLAPGDLVRVAKGGSARIISGDAPGIRISGGKLYRVPGEPSDQETGNAVSSGSLPPELLALGGLGTIGAAAGVAVASTGRRTDAQPLIVAPGCASAGC